MKAQVGIYGNELADQIAKAAARNRDTTIAFNRIPKCTLFSDIEEEAKQKLQKEWKDCTKAAITKLFFPHVQDRLKLKINITPIFAAMVTGHGTPGLSSTDLRYWNMQHLFAVRETKE